MIRVHGYLGTISDSLRQEVADADLVVGGQRHLDALNVPDEKRQKLASSALPSSEFSPCPATPTSLSSPPVTRSSSVWCDVSASAVSRSRS